MRSAFSILLTEMDMKIGIGLPNTVPDTPGKGLLEWARQAEAAGFASLATIGRVTFPGYEELVALAAAAGVTSKIGLFTNVLLAATRDPVLLAKEAASLDQLSGGRFVLGVGAGGREDDFIATERSFHNRGRRLDAAVDLMHRAWKGEPVAGSPVAIGPRPVSGDAVPMLFGGYKPAAFRRCARWGIGYTQGGGTAESLRELKRQVEEAWKEAAREGRPQIRALVYFALGPGSEEKARAYLDTYYQRPQIADSIPKTSEAIQQTIAAYEAVGCDLLSFTPTSSDLDQVERLRDAVGAEVLAAV